MTIRSLKQESRRCHAKPIGLTPTEMIEMVVLDGCFIIELIMKFSKSNKRDKDDPIFKMGWMIMTLQHGLMLLENQLPLT